MVSKNWSWKFCCMTKAKGKSYAQNFSHGIVNTLVTAHARDVGRECPFALKWGRYVTNVWYKQHYLVPFHGISIAVLPLLKFQPLYNAKSLLVWYNFSECPCHNRWYEEQLLWGTRIFPKCHMKMLLLDYSAKVGREDISKPTVGNKSLHKINNLE
jgi:hypothetical protein